MKEAKIINQINEIRKVMPVKDATEEVRQKYNNSANGVKFWYLPLSDDLIKFVFTNGYTRSYYFAEFKVDGTVYIYRRVQP